MNLKEQVNQMDNLVATGDIVGAVETFFAADATTSDYGQAATSNKSQMVEKMQGFLGAIAKVNGITFHKSIVEGSQSASEFTFDFEMKDGSSIYWHEIILRQWNTAGEVIQESYFNAA